MSRWRRSASAATSSSVSNQAPPRACVCVAFWWRHSHGMLLWYLGLSLESLGIGISGLRPAWHHFSRLQVLRDQFTGALSLGGADPYEKPVGVHRTAWEMVLMCVTSGCRSR